MTEASEPQLDTSDAWRELEGLVAQVGQWARSGMPQGEFFVAMLNQLVSTLAAVGGGVWVNGRLGVEWAG